MLAKEWKTIIKAYTHVLIIKLLKWVVSLA